MTGPRLTPQHWGMDSETQQTNLSSVILPGAGETQAQVRVPIGMPPAHPRIPTPYPVVQWLQVELVPNTG